jgi:2-phosphoglycerate kinase
MTSEGKSVAQVLISDREPGLPYSKGLMSSRVMVTGLSPVRSYQVAERIEERLQELGRPSITTNELTEISVEVLNEVAGERYAKNFLRWLEVEALDVPLVLLIGGATGVGKSTIATQLAARLGILRVVATDAIREVMRAMFSRELMPTLYTSSFDAGSVLREAPLQEGDRVITGFREQTAKVAVGLRGILDRAALEGTSLIIEGAHAVPGFVDLEAWGDRVLAVPLVVTVEDEEIHHSHFVARGLDASSRPAERYEDGFDKIRRVQKYIKSQALSHGAPIIPNYNLDQTLASVIDLVIERAIERTRPKGPSTTGTGSAASEEPALANAQEGKNG